VSVQSAGAPPATVRLDRVKSTRRLSRGRLWMVAGGGLLLLSFVRTVTSADDITSAGTLGATISLALPIGLAGLGGLWSERSGVVNIGLEGMMILGTFFGADFAYFSHSPWMGAVGGVVGGLIGGLVHAVATVTFGVDQIVSGVAITILATGLARYLAGVFFTGQPGGGPTQSPSVPQFTRLRVPGADSFLGKLERHHWFAVSDLAGLLRGLATTLTPFTIVVVLLFPLTWFVLWRTAFGLRLRSCGENPWAADTLGVAVYRTKYIAVVISGALAGMGGVFLVFIAGIYRENQTNGRGFIGLAALIFGNWRPGGLAAGAGLFGFADALQLRSRSAVVALLLLVAILLAVLAITQAIKGNVLQSVIAGVVAVGALIAFLTIDVLPPGIVSFTPHLTTLLVLSLASQRLRMPQADGLVYRRGES
jgi:general nucleoside transport system permease protein